MDEASLYQDFIDYKNEARKVIPRPYSTEIPEADQDVMVWVKYHTEVERLGLLLLSRNVWLDGLETGRQRWMDNREFGDKPVNPYGVDTEPST